MSLFQVREWWATKSGTGEEYDTGCMCVDNIDNEPSGAVKIITGSFQGYLRVFYPRQQEFRIEDLMLEENLDAPILQIAVGKFIPNSKENAMAILHPRKLAVYSLQAIGGVGSAASYYELHKNYEHKLGVDGAHFTAFNMCYGAFGGAHGRDLICVQSMDVQLQVFEQDRYAFTRQLRSLVPGPICYAAKIDSIITSNSKMQVECYRYQMLAASTGMKKSLGQADGGEEEKQSISSSGISNAKQVQVDWTCNVGETVVDIRVARLSASLNQNQQDILVLGEHTLLTLKEQGDVRLQHRLGYFPSCCHPYDCGRESVDDGVEGGGGGGGANQHLLVATHNNQIMVYKDTQLLWAARTATDASCVQMHVEEFGVGQPNAVKGLVVTLATDGSLGVNYMGTDPPTQVVGATESKELNYEEMDDEHRRLLNIIRESQSDQRMEPRERVLLRAQVPTIVDPAGEGVEDEDFMRAGDAELCARNVDDGSILQITARLFVSYTGSDTLRNVNISLDVPPNIIARESAVLLPNLDGSTSTPLIIPLTFRANNSMTPSSLTVKVVAAYSTETGEPRTAQCDIQLPMCLSCRLVPPVKHNTFKFTLNTNRLPPQLSHLFEDMLTQPGITEEFVARVAGSSANVLSFEYYNGVAATILVSKNAGRYRVQAGTLEALWMVASELTRRLSDHFRDAPNSKSNSNNGGGGSGENNNSNSNASDTADSEGGEFAIQYQEPLPLADFFAIIDDHFAYRKELADVNADLNDRAHQFRIIQKRLLLRFKDRNPSPLNQLDTIMHATYTQLIDLADKCSACQTKLKQAAVHLSCATYLMLMLIRYRFNLDQENYDLIKSHLSPDVVDNTEQGWEEITDAAMTNVLRTSLAKSAKESAAVPAPLQMPDDTNKLKKHITIVCDRLAKGARLARGGAGNESKVKASEEKSHK